MIDDEDDAHRPLPVVLRPVEDELLSSWLARHAAYYGVTGPFFAKWLMLGTRNLSVLDHRLGLAQIARLSEKLRRDPIALIAMTFIDAPAGLDLFRRYLEIGSVVPSISPPWACPSPRAISSRPVSSRTSPRPRGLAAQGKPRWRSDEGLPLMITPLPGIGRGDLHSGTRSLWRYAASFPVPVANPVSMGEGCTPLVEQPWRGGRANFKLEWFGPTGSFKDRGASGPSARSSGYSTPATIGRPSSSRERRR